MHFRLHFKFLARNALTAIITNWEGERNVDVEDIPIALRDRCDKGADVGYCWILSRCSRFSLLEPVVRILWGSKFARASFLRKR